AVALPVRGVALGNRLTPWTAGVAAVLALVVACRSRLFPLVAQKVSLTLAGLAVLGRFLFAWAEAEPWGVWPALGIALVVAGIPLVVLSVEHAEDVRARLRGITSRLEAVAVVVLVPLAVGAFDTYQRLLESF